MKPIAAIVVVYNTFCGDSPTCRALSRVENLQVLIYDNSTRELNNREYCQKAGWTYLGGEGNMGISKAYNACIDYLQAQNFRGLVCLFDDDTPITGEYFSRLRECARASAKRIFVPVILSGGTVLSPMVLTKQQRVRRFADEAALRSYQGADLSAINSGMAVDMAVFTDYRYDENIFLDGVDHTFLVQQKARGEEMEILDYVCSHGFSGDQRPSRQAAEVRYRIFAKDYRYILRDEPGIYRRLVGKRGLRLTLQYKTLAFLKIFLQTK